MGKQGKLFVFEGPDDSGKTTLSLAVAEYFRSQGVECVYSAFPGRESGTLGRLVHELHHNSQASGVQMITPTSLQVLHVAAHVDAIESRILPALQTGRNVVLDRFWWSTLVYGRVRGADRKALQKMVQLEQACWAAHSPAILFLLQRSNSSSSASTENDWRAVSEEYAKVASEEAGRYPVCFVENEGDFADALSKVINRIFLSEELSESDGSTTTNGDDHPASTDV